MGAESSAQREPGKIQELQQQQQQQEEDDASASAAEVKVLQEVEGGALLTKPLQKNGQISSMSSLNGHTEDNTLSEVGQPDAVSPKEEAPENTVTTQEEVAPQVNGDKVEKESPDANDISAVEETAVEEKPDDATEVGFKKIFRFVGFKFTLKKDKSEEKDPVKLLTIKDKEGDDVGATDEPAKEEEAAVTAEEKSTAEEKEADTEAPTVEAAEVPEDKPENAETTDAPADGAAPETTDGAAKEEEANKEGEATSTLSPFRKLFGGGLFSNLKKKASMKKTKEEEEKEAAAEETTAKTEETPAEKEEKEVESEQQIKEEEPATSEEEKSESKEEASVTTEEAKSDATEATVETPAPMETTTEEQKQEEEKVEGTTEEEKDAPEVTSEAEVLSSQEKAKPQGSPLKKLFTGAGLKKLSTKKQKTKKDPESKLTESGEQAAEQLQSSTESTEAPKAESGPSSPEDSGEHVIAVEVTQKESSQEAETEVTSDGEKKKEGIIAWSSFKRLVTPKKLVKRSSDSEDEATCEKPEKSATLSSSESAQLTEKNVEEEEVKEEKPSEEEPKTENTEKLVSSTEEPKKKMDTSVSWEALMCMGGTKKRTRKTSDSDDEETKVEEEVTAAEPATEGEEEAKTEPATTPQNAESEEEVTSPEPVTNPPERESTWETLKRMVMSKNKPKVEEKPEENENQVQEEAEVPKEESSFSLRKFFPGRRKKKVEKQSSTEGGEEDSDTPAVVPLSEYDDQPEQKAEPAEPAVEQTKTSTEERAPSWIPANIEAENQHDQLSDIPEEAENAATPKSVDTDATEDETEASLTPPASSTGRRLSTAEVASVTPAPNAQATIVPQESTNQCATEVLEVIEAQISEIPAQTSVTVEDVPVHEASEKTEFEPEIDTAECKTNAILQVHPSEDAMAICTGLGTKEIAKVAMEKNAVPLVEVMAVVRDPLSTEVAVEEKPTNEEQAIGAEDSVFAAQVLQVDTTQLEPLVENSVGDEVEVQVATGSQEAQMEKIGVITTALEESVVAPFTTVNENSPKAVMVNPITPTCETTVCTQTVEVTETRVVTHEVKMDMEKLDSATGQNEPIREVVEVMTEEISSTICDTTKATIAEENEPNVCVVLPSMEAPVVTDTVLMTSHRVESCQVESSEEIVITTVSVSETVSDQVKEMEVVVMESAVQAPETEISVANEEVSQISKEEVRQACESEAQDMAKVRPEPEENSIPTPAQATVEIEKEIEMPIESPVITNVPEATICEQPAPKSPQPLLVAMQVVDTIPIEVAGSLDAPEQNEETEKLEQVKEESQETDVEERQPEKTQVVLQIAHVVEEESLEEEAVVEFDSNGLDNHDASVEAEQPASSNKLATLSEESSEAEAEKTSTAKCAEVMAQVIEVIEEAVKEIEPTSTEITAAS